ncbi:MAG: ABC transporter permease [Nitrososphaerota archaeon]|jgi:peptide/nickel transport system permease protein|nr:ABC transporter permease [Nitrososphaerota archaeon]
MQNERVSDKRPSTIGMAVRRFRLRFLRTTSAKVGWILVLLVLVSVLVGPLVLSYSPYAISGLPNSPPSLKHPFGTDYLGHDLLSQVIYGAYPSLLVGLAAAVSATIIGFVVGALGGYYQKLEWVLSASTDSILSIPALPLLLLIGIIFVVTDQLIVAGLTLVLWAPAARALRAQVAALKKMPYVDAARTSGMSDSKILWTVIVPKIGSIAMAYFITLVSVSIVIATALEFLGIGNPEVVSWGSILYFAQQYGFYLGDWWWVLAPGLAITVVAAGFALIGFSVEEILNPRLRT